MKAAERAGVEAVRRWVAGGGQWRVVTRSATAVEIGLFTCDGGEEMQRVTLSVARLAELGVRE